MIRSEFTLEEIAKELGYSGESTVRKRFDNIAEKISRSY